MAKQSSIFLRNLSVVDCAVVYPDGTIHGHSFHPNFIVTGDVDEQEQVVIDFSKCKNEIKKAIDDFTRGYDHKCWIIEGYSGCDLQILDSNLNQAVFKSDAVEANVPVHVFRLIENPNKSDNVKTVIEESVAKYVEEHLKQFWPSVSVDVEMGTQIFNNPNNITGIFQYFHGLKSSSSTRCRRGMHGHGSFYEFEVYADEISQGDLEDLHAIMDQYRDVCFVDKNIIESEDDTWVELKYIDIGGDFYNIKIDKTKIDIVKVPTDTTIENIVEFIATTNAAEFDRLGVKRFFASEGLAKGSVYTF